MKDTILLIITLISILLICTLMMFNIIEKKERLDKCKEASLELGFPDYDIVKGKCYGKSNTNSLFLYKIN